MIRIPLGLGLKRKKGQTARELKIWSSRRSQIGERRETGLTGWEFYL